jgi:uncharacterized membrane protein YoaK (UPF0700 family)
MRKPRTEFFARTRQSRISAEHPAVPMVLSFCSAFVDVTCYLGLFHSFTAFITGTLVILCSELFRYDQFLWIRVLILATFLISAVAWIHIIKRLLRSRRRILRLGLGLESVLLLLFMGSALALPVNAHVLAGGTTFALIFATLAMSLQNAVMQLVLNYHVPTTVMTGNFMRFLITTIERRGTVGPNDAMSVGKSSGPTTHYGWSLLWFAIGGALGALCLTYVGFWGILVPAGVLAFIAIVGDG